jgi:hypothetical protein
MKLKIIKTKHPVKKRNFYTVSYSEKNKIGHIGKLFYSTKKEAQKVLSKAKKSIKI